MQFTTTALSIVLAALPLVRANGCYSGGESFSQYGTADELLAARTDACNALAVTYTAGQTESYCAVNGEVHINFSVKSNAGSGSLALSSGDCLAAMTVEMNACGNGSENDHGSFHYVADPNAGGAC